MRWETRADARTEVERGGIADAGAVVVGDGDGAGGGEFAELLGDAVHEHDFDREAAQDGDIDEEVAEVFIGHDGTVEGDHKDLVPEARDVFEDATQVGGLERGARQGGGGRAGKGIGTHR